MPKGPAPADVTIIMVSYNTRDLTLRAIETLLASAGDVAFRLIVWDNASADGSADAIAAAYPQVELHRSHANIGFARANNAVAKMAESEFLLLLNPDTETHSGAVENLLAFARRNPQAGIVGGRTVFPDGSLNKASCWNRQTPWSLFCAALGLSHTFQNSRLFNPEEIGGWQRDSVREVDIVVGCFFLLRASLWHELGGFRERYFMYGEEADMCLRARKLGYRPMITPDAQIMHLVGASTAKREDKIVRLFKAKVTLIRDHWSNALQPVGIGLLWLRVALRMAALTLRPKRLAHHAAWEAVWRQRKEWLRGY